MTKAWQRHVVRTDGGFVYRAYTFCVLDELRKAVRRRDVFVAPSWRYSDPRAGLLTGAKWEATRPIVCRSLELSADPEPTLTALADELDKTYRMVAKRLPNNPAVEFETIERKKRLSVEKLEPLDEAASLVALREAVAARLPEVDLPEILLEIPRVATLRGVRLRRNRCPRWNERGVRLRRNTHPQAAM